MRHVWLVGCLVAACDGSAMGADAGSDAHEDADAGPVLSCEGASEGTPCVGGDANICVGGACAESVCGDGYVDAVRGEDCEDGNETAFDGCEPVSCEFTCTESTRCTDGLICNGEETCSDHRCVPGPAAPDGTPCMIDETTAGVCHPLPSPVCQVAECGNGRRDEGEDCDDGRHLDPEDGCTEDCTLFCAGSAAGCDLSLFPRFFDFGTVAAGELSEEQTFTLQNVGASASLDAPSFRIAGVNASEFEPVSDTCELPINMVDACTVTVRFAPTGAFGLRHAMLIVEAGAGFAGAAELFGSTLGEVGTACEGDEQCGNGQCVDGVCCASSADACGGCYACNVAGSEGACAPVPAGADPHGECGEECEVEGECDGSGACRAAPAGTVCLIEPCTRGEDGYRQWNGAITSGIHVCNGVGTSCPSGRACPAPYTCDPATNDCRSSCTRDLDCRLGYRCDTSGACVTGRAWGEPCARSTECQSSGLTCIAGACRECATAADCRDGAACSTDGRCLTCNQTGGSCAMSGWGTFCDTNNGECGFCTTDDDCDSVRAPTCVRNQCACDGASRICGDWGTCLVDPDPAFSRCGARSGHVCNTDGRCASGSCVDGICS